jgi:hypothetical protein
MRLLRASVYSGDPGVVVAFVLSSAVNEDARNAAAVVVVESRAEHAWRIARRIDLSTSRAGRFAATESPVSSRPSQRPPRRHHHRTQQTHLWLCCAGIETTAGGVVVVAAGGGDWRITKQNNKYGEPKNKQ